MNLKVYPLSDRSSLTNIEGILVEPSSPARPCSETIQAHVRECARLVLKAQARGAGIILMYGAHLLRNGAALILDEMMERGWLTHLATNGAGTIHDWEFAWLGRSTESVRNNVPQGLFGAWDETGKNIMLALLAGGVQEEGYGESLGRFILEDGVTFPNPEQLRYIIGRAPDHPLTAARADLLRIMETFGIPSGEYSVVHKWKKASILAHAYRHGVPMTIHPGIGYDIIANHPIYDGSVVGRAATTDFRLFGNSVDTLEGGLLLSVGSAIMAPKCSRRP